MRRIYGDLSYYGKPFNVREPHVSSTLCLSLLIILFESGCGQPQSQIPSPPPTKGTVTITPPSLVLKHGDSWNFAASIDNAKDMMVTWSVQEGPAGGMINDSGTYTAPAAEGVYHVIATSKADPAKSAKATISVGDTGFTLTGSLSTARFGHTATLLPNGTVYIGGGGIESTDPDIDDGIAMINTAEVFDPITGTSQTVNKLTRFDHTATLLQNGDILFTGGIVGDTPTGIILTETAELLKAGSGLLQPTGSMAFARYLHTATTLQDGRVLITGGYTWTGKTVTTTQSAELYDPALGSFARVGDMGVAREGHSGTLLPNGKVLITGGGVKDTELFDPATNSFAALGSTSSKSVNTATLLPDGKVLITGEKTPDLTAPTPSELYDPATSTVTLTGTMTTLRFGYTATLLPDGTVLIAGGETHVPGSVAGTYFPTSVTTTEIYNPATGSFSPGPTIRQGRALYATTLMPDGSVLFVGGRADYSSAYAPLASAETFR